MRQITRVLTLFLTLTISSVYAQNLSLVGHLPYTLNLSDVWGHADTTGVEYALVGVNNGFSIVSLANPATPTEVQFVPGPSTIWRDIKTWQNHAYVTNESTGGLLIVDMTGLPASAGSMPTKNFTNNGQFSSAHNIFIDSAGFAYIFGANFGNGGALIYDLSDPWNPVYAGIFDDYYFHDGMVQEDTLWGSAVYAGVFSKVDVSNRAAPVALATAATPNNFTHNAWISDDSKTLFTTDEVGGGFIGAYDVSDATNIVELDRWQSSPGQNVIPHNTHFLNDFLITSYYRDGIIINDVTYPYNIIQTARYDSSPLTGNGFDGSWGAYPYLPSGLILNTDIDDGLDILSYDNVRACYLEGHVYDAVSNNTINDVDINVIGGAFADKTDLVGFYATGYAQSGMYDVVYSKIGYITDTVAVQLNNGVLSTQDVYLQPDAPFSATGTVVNAMNQALIPNANIELIGPSGTSYFATTDAAGSFSINNVFGGTYEILAGKWGFVTECKTVPLSMASSSVVVELPAGYHDDFTFDFGWTVQNIGATAGLWERGVPNGTTSNGFPYNPDSDLTFDCGDKAFVTGNSPTGGVGDDDVDGGSTILISPIMDLSNMNSPQISFRRWFANGSGGGTPNDSLVIQLTDGVTTKTIDFAGGGTLGSWSPRFVRVKDYFQNPNATMQLIAIASDFSPGHLVEAGLDLFTAKDTTNVSIEEFEQVSMNLFPNPSNTGFNINSDLNLTSGTVEVYGIDGKLHAAIPVSSSNYYEPEVSMGTYIVQLKDGNGKMIAREVWLKN